MLLSQLSNAPVTGPDINILGLTADSRDARSGWLFAALNGARHDGQAFIADAVRNGAVAVLALPGTPVPAGTVAIYTTDPRRDFALMAARFYHAQPENIVAVTGTNGKTSTVHFTQQLWTMSGLKAASLGTLGVQGHNLSRPGSMTTPDSVALHAMLADLAAGGISHLAMEASSHGLQQSRLDGVTLKAAGFTNLTRDHLDYHPDMDQYFSAKARLFDAVLPAGGTAILNQDIPEFHRLEKICTARGVAVHGYGEQGLELKIHSRKPTPHGQDIVIEVMGQRHHLVLPLVGAFMVMNALCALGLAMAGAGRMIDAGLLSRIEGAPGRLQLVSDNRSHGAVYVDYAHTPDALENILLALRPHTAGRLICLFGCGGDRDPGKRPIMGRIATELSDIAIVTDDNPRTEDADTIRKAIRSGAASDIEDIPGRRDAIAHAVEIMQPGDVLVLAGKGHEQGQIFADHVEPFDDLTVARQAMREIKGAA